MLKQRIITAMWLLPLAIGVIFLLPTPWFALVLGGAMLLGAWEWTNLMGLTLPREKALFIGVQALLMAICYGFWLPGIIVIALVWWVIAVFLVKRYPENVTQWSSRPTLFVMGTVVLLPTWMALVLLQKQDDGPLWVMYVMTLVWSADTGAYFAGRRFGTRKLAPKVSPGKSTAGVWGGLAATAIVACLVAYNSGFADNIGTALFLLISMIAVLASVLGDLLESMLKRHRGIKDSSNLLPGHGGILDRIDSVTAAAPVFAGLMYLAGGWG